MKIWQMILATTAFTILIGGSYLGWVWKQRHKPSVAELREAEQQVTLDDVAVIKAYFPSHFEDTKRIEGTSVWEKNGYIMPYFHAKGTQIDFSKSVGVIPALERLDVKKIVLATAPARLNLQMGHGRKQAYALFTLKGGGELYATPIGSQDGSQEIYFSDLLFFYDDPHTVYDNWSKAAWAIVDAHQVKPGMSELQTRLSIGQMMQPQGATEGERTVVYHQNDKVWTISYEKNKAVSIDVKDDVAAKQR